MAHPLCDGSFDVSKESRDLKKMLTKEIGPPTLQPLLKTLFFFSNLAFVPPSTHPFSSGRHTINSRPSNHLILLTKYIHIIGYCYVSRVPYSRTKSNNGPTPVYEVRLETKPLSYKSDTQIPLLKVGYITFRNTNLLSLMINI